VLGIYFPFLLEASFDYKLACSDNCLLILGIRLFGGGLFYPLECITSRIGSGIGLAKKDSLLSSSIRGGIHY